jgi:hypothetical protein
MREQKILVVEEVLLVVDMVALPMLSQETAVKV